MKDSRSGKHLFPSNTLIKTWAVFFISGKDLDKNFCITEERFLPQNATKDLVWIWDIEVGKTSKIIISPERSGRVFSELDGPYLNLSRAVEKSLILEPPEPEWLPIRVALSHVLYHIELSVLLEERREIYGELLKLENNGKIILKEIQWAEEYGVLTKVPGITVADMWRAVAELDLGVPKSLREGVKNLMAAIDRGSEFKSSMEQRQNYIEQGLGEKAVFHPNRRHLTTRFPLAELVAESLRTQRKRAPSDSPTSRESKRRGPKPRYNPESDERIMKLWKSGRQSGYYTTIEDLARELSVNGNTYTVRDIQRLLQRVRARQRMAK